MSITLRNHATFLSTAWLQAALDAITPWELHDEFEAVFHEGEKNEGISQDVLGYIEITISQNTTFPHTGPAQGEYMAVKTWSFEELLVWLIAHEGRHQYQSFHSHVFPKVERGVLGIEKDAEESALRTLRAYRIGSLQIPRRATVKAMPRAPGMPVYLPLPGELA